MPQVQIGDITKDPRYPALVQKFKQAIGEAAAKHVSTHFSMRADARLIERELASKAIECGAQSLAKDALIAELTLEKMNELSDANDTLAAANERLGLENVALKAKVKALEKELAAFKKPIAHTKAYERVEKVYIVTEGAGYEESPEAVFTSKEKADAYIANNTQPGKRYWSEPQEFEIDPT